eukprot:6985739-Prymnesium_polylepis.2
MFCTPGVVCSTLPLQSLSHADTHSKRSDWYSTYSSVSGVSLYHHDLGLVVPGRTIRFERSYVA